MSSYWVRCVGGVLLLVALSGCGGGPSDRDVQAAVNRYYSCSHDFDFLTRMPVGAERGSQSKLTEVRVKKRGEPFQPNMLQSLHKPMGAVSDGYPIRVHVKGTIRRNVLKSAAPEPPVGRNAPLSSSSRHEDAQEPFDGDADFVLWYVRSDKSKVDPEPDFWVAHPQ